MGKIYIDGKVYEPEQIIWYKGGMVGDDCSFFAPWGTERVSDGERSYFLTSDQLPNRPLEILVQMLGIGAYPIVARTVDEAKDYICDEFADKWPLLKIRSF